MKLHLVALPHTQVSTEFCGCAYTSKILKFCKMLGGEYEILVYAPAGPDIPWATLVPCLSERERTLIFGNDDPNRLPAWPRDDQAYSFNNNVIDAIRKYIGNRDLILLTAGWTHRVIAEAFPAHICCEPGVGYEGILTNYCAFESYAWMHHVYSNKGIKDGRWFDCVIPNYFDPAEFDIAIPSPKNKYLLFLGRLIARKGVHIASQIAEACNLPLYVAGAGGRQDGKDIVADEVIVRNAEYIGPVNIYERAELLANAIALICPTLYIEPFGGVAVEAMMAGTPVIAPDWGAFVETVKPGISGFRFRTLKEAKSAVEKAPFLDRSIIQDYARANYSLTSIAPLFKAWFDRLNSLWEKGWYQLD